jgi:hypothetical protein
MADFAEEADLGEEKMGAASTARELEVVASGVEGYEAVERRVEWTVGAA